MILLPFYGLLPVCPARPLTSDINKAFSSTQLLLTGHFLFLGPLPVKPRDGCDDVNIPVYLQLVKCSDCQSSTSTTMFTTFKITFVPFRHPPLLLELLLLHVVLTTSTCLNALRCCRVVMFVCFFLTLDSSRGRKEMHQIITTYIVNIAPSIVRTVTHVRWQPCWRRFTSDGLSDTFTPHW